MSTSVISRVAWVSCLQVLALALLAWPRLAVAESAPAASVFCLRGNPHLREVQRDLPPFVHEGGMGGKPIVEAQPQTPLSHPKER